MIRMMTQPGCGETGRAAEQVLACSQVDARVTALLQDGFHVGQLDLLPAVEHAVFAQLESFMLAAPLTGPAGNSCVWVYNSEVGYVADLTSDIQLGQQACSMQHA